MKRLIVRQAFAALWVFVLSIGASGIALSQEAAAASAPPRQELGQRAVKFVVDRFVIDPTNLIPKTKQPISAKGSWSISEETPTICAKINLPCILLSYIEPGTDVICQWTILFGSNDGLLLDLNEEAGRYFTSKPYDKNNSKDAPGSEWSGGKRVSSVPPTYPEIAKSSHVEGDVKLLVRFSETGGHPIDIHAISGPSVLQSSAMDAVGQWVYTPLLINSVPISTRNIIVVRFHSR